MTEPATLTHVQPPHGAPLVLAADPFPTHSPGFSKLATALAKARDGFEAIRKNREVTVSTKTGGSYKFKYAELSDIYAATDPSLAANGLSHSGSIAPIQAKLHLVTTLMHESGEWLRSYMPLTAVNEGPQAFGSQLTYYKRYAISALLGVSSEDDDDGNAAEGNAVTESRRKPAFANAALRNKFQENVTASFKDADTLDALKELAKLNKPRFDEMEASGNEHDALLLDELRKQYGLHEARIRKLTADEDGVIASHGPGFASMREGDYAE